MKQAPLRTEPQSDWARGRAYRWWMDWFGGIKEFTHDTRGINQLAVMLREVADEARQESLEALREIAKGEGRYSRDPLEHASNTIDDMKALAVAAIAKAGG